MIQLNLLPDIKKEFVNAQKTKSLVVTIAILVSVAAAALSILLFVYVTFIQQFQIKLATDDIITKTNQLKAVTDINKYITVQNQLAALPALHDTKGVYSRLFDFLPALNPQAPNNVSINNLKLATTENAIGVTGSTKTFEALNIFVDTLKNATISYKAGGQGDFVTKKMFDQVRVESAALANRSGKTNVGFTIRLTYNQDVFTAVNTDMTVAVPSITTTPSVSQSPTAQIFNSQER